MTNTGMFRKKTQSNAAAARQLPRQTRGQGRPGPESQPWAPWHRAELGWDNFLPERITAAALRADGRGGARLLPSLRPAGAHGPAVSGCRSPATRSLNNRKLVEG